jgi:uncharacterized protein YrrD
MDEFDFNIGAQVHCQDGKCGKLAKVVVHPDTWQVTDLIVEEGFLLKRARVFPITVVESTTAEDIYLSIESADLNNYREYREVEYEQPAFTGQTTPVHTGEVVFPGGVTVTDWNVPVVRRKVHMGISSQDLQLIKQGTPVENHEGVIGKVDHVIIDAHSNEITHLVVRHGIISIERLDIPISLVEHIGENHVLVTATNEELKQLPPYEPPDRPQSETVVVGQSETITEHTTKESILVSDQALADQIEAVLFADPRTGTNAIEVINDRGVITLGGEVDSQAQREAAGEIAAAQPGVISVVNTLRVR